MPTSAAKVKKNEKMLYSYYSLHYLTLFCFPR